MNKTFATHSNIFPNQPEYYKDGAQQVWPNVCFSLIPIFQILFSADDEMDESDEDDIRRQTGLKTVKKKKLRMGIPV